MPASTSLVIGRDGVSYPYDETWVHDRIDSVSRDLDRKFVDVDMLTDIVSRGITDNIAVDKLNDLVAQTAAYAVTKHPHYGLLGGRLSVLTLHENTSDSVLETFRKLHDHRSYQNNRASPLISEDVWRVVETHHEVLQEMIDYTRDMTYEYFGFKTLERSYLLRSDLGNGKNMIIERPQHLFLRVALGIHVDDLHNVRLTYDLMSQGYFTHATPTLFNAGMPNPQMSSCFLVAMKEDSIEGIYDTLKECALISKAAGGIGVHVHNIRCSGSYIAGTNGMSNGLVPLLRVFNNTARYVDQGGGKRKGAFAIYLEPWHADIFEFMLLKRNTGKEDQRARDLFYALWIPDEFMRRVKAGAKWTLMDPSACPELPNLYGDAFDTYYRQMEAEGKGVRVVDAKDVWFAILESQIETGVPFILFKDACNRKSNQKNLGTIKCSNLCTEIVEYTSPEETAVCNLASVALPKYVAADGSYDFQRLHDVTKTIVYNLNRVIDRNYYPVETARRSNVRHRPIGLGVQGLADTFIMMRLPFTSPEAQRLNEDIFETLYHAAVESSVDLAARDGPYETFAGSPASEGLLQFDLWGATPKSGRWDWTALKSRIAQHGMRNSLLIAPMPTASTSQILGNNECFEPFTSNLYVRRVLSGEFPVVNKFLVRDLIERGLWTERIRNEIITFNGSIKNIPEIPEDLRELYKTVWEIKQRELINMAADRGKYIDQSQSLNLFLENPNSAQITSMHFYSWEKGLKTGMYYLRTRPAADAIKFTVDARRMKEVKDSELSSSRSVSRSTSETSDCINCGS